MTKKPVGLSRLDGKRTDAFHGKGHILNTVRYHDSMLADSYLYVSACSTQQQNWQLNFSYKMFDSYLFDTCSTVICGQAGKVMMLIYYIKEPNSAVRYVMPSRELLKAD